MKYEVTITAIGSLAATFLQKNRSIILMNRDIYPNVSDMVVEHTKCELFGDVTIGDKLTLGWEEYTIASIGCNALKTLRDQGHCTLVFNTSIEMPGQIALTGGFLPRLLIGDALRIK